MTPKEIELKFRLVPGDLETTARADCLAGMTWSAQTLRSLYFDTPTRQLRQAGIALRLRSQGRTRSIGLKWPDAEAFARGELEIPTRSRTIDSDALSRELDALCQRDALDQEDVEVLERLIGRQPLESQFETVVRRKHGQLFLPGARIEIALDMGQIRLPGRRIPICELELELKEGDPVALFNFALQLSDAAPLRLGLLSKGEQGFAALTGQVPDAVRAGRLTLQDNDTLDSAIAAILLSSLDQFTANWPSLAHSDAPDAIHQMRVGLRRMRAALGLFRRQVNCPEFGAFGEDAKRIASQLGEARDLDVFAAHLREGPAALLTEEAGLGRLLDRVEQERANAYATARALVSAPQTTRFVLALHRFIAAKGWRMTLPSDQLMILSQSATDFAARALERLHKKALKRGRRMNAPSPAERHELRIILKKLRYCAEFFEALFGHEKRKRHARKVMAQLQDRLGSVNDMATARRLIERLDDQPGLDRAVGIVLGWTGHALVWAEQSIASSWSAFKEIPRFWSSPSQTAMARRRGQRTQTE